MYVFDENNNTIMLNCIDSVNVTERYWALDLELFDFRLVPLILLQQETSPGLTLSIKGFEFVVPASWNILVYSEETHELDVVEIKNLAAKEFYAYVGGPDVNNLRSEIIKVVDYTPSYEHTYPALEKSIMLSHPISPTEWINITYSDVYNRYLKNKMAGDLLF